VNAFRSSVDLKIKAGFFQFVFQWPDEIVDVFIPFPFGFLATPPDEVAFFFFFSVFLSLLVVYYVPMAFSATSMQLIGLRQKMCLLTSHL